MIPDAVLRQALAELHAGGCACHEFCFEGGAGAGREVCACFCHTGQPLTLEQRAAAARRLAPRFDRARGRAIALLVLGAVPASAPAEACA